MLGVAALLASSSMAAIELITLYARLDNAVHKNAPPTHTSANTLFPTPLSSHHLTLRLLGTRCRKGSRAALEELELLLFYLLPTMRRRCCCAEPVLRE